MSTPMVGASAAMPWWLPAGDLALRHDFDGPHRDRPYHQLPGQRKPMTRLFLLSRDNDRRRTAQTVQDHWAIENTLHWSLDVTFNEDQSRARKDNAPANIALIGRIAMTLLQRIDDPKHQSEDASNDARGRTTTSSAQSPICNSPAPRERGFWFPSPQG